MKLLKKSRDLKTTMKTLTLFVHCRVHKAIQYQEQVTATEAALPPQGGCDSGAAM